MTIKIFFLYSGNSLDEIYSIYFYKIFPNNIIFGSIKYFSIIFICILIIYSSRKNINWNKFFLSATLIFTLLLLLDFLNMYKVNEKYESQSNISNYNTKKKIILILLDEFDFNYAYKKNKKIRNKFNLENYFVSTKMFASGNATMESLPQILTGLESKNFFEKDGLLFFKDINDNEVKLKFTNSIFHLPGKYNYDLNVISTTLNYCKIFREIKKCKSKENRKYSEKLKEAIEYNFSLISKIKEVYYMFKANNVLTEIGNYDLSNFEFIDDKNVLSFDDIMDTINNETGMIYIHLAVPHPDTEKFDSFVHKHFNRVYKSNNLKAYDLRIEYSLNLIDSIMKKINKNPETLIIFFSDHGTKLIKKPEEQKEVLFIARFLDDMNGYTYDKKVNTSVIYKIINNFFNQNIKNNSDILEILQK